MAAASVLGLATGAVILRTSGLALLMLGMAVSLMLGEAANQLPGLTGGADGLQGIEMAPVLGLFAFDLYGRTAYLYSLAVLFAATLAVRAVVNAPFGRSLAGIRQNPGAHAGDRRAGLVAAAGGVHAQRRAGRAGGRAVGADQPIRFAGRVSASTCRAA